MSKRPRGPKPNWKPSSARQKGILADILEAYAEHERADTLPRGGRGIFYDLRPSGRGHGVTYRKPDSQHPAGSFGPMEAHPAAVQEVLALARRAGMVPETWVADGRAVDASVPGYDFSAEGTIGWLCGMVTGAAEDFELDPQRGQPAYVEVLCEAADLQARIARIANPYGVPVYSGGGFDGLKGKRAFANRALEREVLTVVLHIGDRDDYGDNIYVAAAEDAVAWADETGLVTALDWLQDPEQLTEMRKWLGVDRGLVFVRLALTPEQADDLDLLDADGKAEVDAVPVSVLDGWVRDAIEALQDPAHRERLLDEEEQERDRLRDALPGAIRRALGDDRDDR